MDICLEHYADTIAMFEDLGMGGSNETILALNNFAICHRRKGNFDEAMTLLTKAEEVAERELEVDHKWKVLIKTELAFLYDEMGNQKQMIALIKEGLLMGQRLNLSIAQMANKHEIPNYIQRFPGKFPKKEFPR